MRHTELDYYNITYDLIYDKYHFLLDEDLINKWKYHQHHTEQKEDYDWIGFNVCEDLLRQRGNTYLDYTYPKD